MPPLSLHLVDLLVVAFSCASVGFLVGAFVGVVYARGCA
jgi:hypothetical protein